jgi:hypothetical protein
LDWTRGGHYTLMPDGASREPYGRAELRLRELLFGDAVFSAGQLKGDETREHARVELRRMRTAFDDAIERTAEADAHEDLANHLHEAAASAARSTRPAADERGVAVLIALIDDDDVAGHAIAALRALGPKSSVPYLLEARPRLEAVLARDTASDFAKGQARKALARLENAGVA